MKQLVQYYMAKKYKKITFQREVSRIITAYQALHIRFQDYSSLFVLLLHPHPTQNMSGSEPIMWSDVDVSAEEMNLGWEVTDHFSDSSLQPCKLIIL